MPPNPKGIESISLGLRGTRYPRKFIPAALTLEGMHHLPRTAAGPAAARHQQPSTPHPKSGLVKGMIITAEIGTGELADLIKNIMTHPLCQVRSFAIVGPYTLKVGFDDGLCREIDFRPILQGGLYGPLRDLGLFDQVRLGAEVHTLVWPNGADFDPATLHDWPSPAVEVAGAVDHWQQPSEAAARR